MSAIASLLFFLFAFVRRLHYKFIGELDMPKNFDKIKVNTRKGVEVEYLRTTKTA